MADILPFKRKKLSEKHKGNTLCRSGFHKWKIEQKQKFDVKGTSINYLQPLTFRLVQD